MLGVPLEGRAGGALRTGGNGTRSWLGAGPSKGPRSGSAAFPSTSCKERLVGLWSTELGSMICVVLSHQMYGHLSQQPRDTCTDAHRCLGKRSNGRVVAVQWRGGLGWAGSEEVGKGVAEASGLQWGPWGATVLSTSGQHRVPAVPRLAGLRVQGQEDPGYGAPPGPSSVSCPEHTALLSLPKAR